MSSENQRRELNVKACNVIKSKQIFKNERN